MFRLPSPARPPSRCRSAPLVAPGFAPRLRFGEPADGGELNDEEAAVVARSPYAHASSRPPEFTRLQIRDRALRLCRLGDDFSEAVDDDIEFFAILDGSRSGHFRAGVYRHVGIASALQPRLGLGFAFPHLRRTSGSRSALIRRWSARLPECQGSGSEKEHNQARCDPFSHLSSSIRLSSVFGPQRAVVVHDRVDLGIAEDLAEGRHRTHLARLDAVADEVVAPLRVHEPFPATRPPSEWQKPQVVANK